MDAKGGRLLVAAEVGFKVVPLKTDPFEVRFQNWVRWCNQKGLYRGRVGSAEGDWRSPQIWDPPEPRPEPINDPDAVEMNRAYTQLAMTAPTYARAIQVLVFRPYLRPQRQGQILGVNYQKLDQLLHKSKQMMKNILGLQAS